MEELNKKGGKDGFPGPRCNRGSQGHKPDNGNDETGARKTGSFVEKLRMTEYNE